MDTLVTFILGIYSHFIILCDNAIYACIHVCIYVCTCACMHACIHVYMHAWMYVCTFFCKLHRMRGLFWYPHHHKMGEIVADRRSRAEICIDFRKMSKHLCLVPQIKKHLRRIIVDEVVWHIPIDIIFWMMHFIILCDIDMMWYDGVSISWLYSNPPWASPLSEPSNLQFATKIWISFWFIFFWYIVTPSMG